MSSKMPPSLSALALGAVAASSFFAAPAHALLNFSNVFGDSMVLQRGVPALIFGFDTPGSTVTTAFNGVTLKNVTGADGVWRQRLPPQPATLTPTTITATSSAGGSASITDVLFGDVYLCGGQSNMQFSVSAGLNATAEIAAANYPYIRVMTVGQGTSSNTPLTHLGTIEQTWTPATPSSIGGAGPGNGDFQFFSAICYFFGRDVHLSLGGTVPVGLVSDNWGGTCLQAWAPASVSAACGMTYTPNLYNAMIAPYVLGPMALTGFLWSQGECNADANQTAFYSCAFRPFIDAWRSEFGVPDAFFGFELLPAYIRDSSFSPESLPYERAAQLTALAGGDASIVTTNGMDLGDATAPHGSVHPRNKQVVGARFASAALEVVYGRPTAYRNPTYAAAAAVTSNLVATVTVTFDPATVGASLAIVPNDCPVSQGVPAGECAWHEIQTADGVWTNATATLTPDGSALVLTAPVGSAGLLVNATRSSFSPWPVVTLYNAAGFPALPWWAAVDSAVAE